jgi:acetylornithine aminotransferase/acetylornithine/N-succinyldiaminopimelate aminotransferase
MGAMLCTEEAARAITPGMHGTTFGGNPLACAVAIAVIDEIKHTGLLDHVRETGNYFLAQLRKLQIKHAAIKDIRGLGLMVGVELDSPELAKYIATGLLERRIIINRTHETVLRFLPPYLITREHVDQAITAIDELLALYAHAEQQLTTQVSSS